MHQMNIVKVTTVGAVLVSAIATSVLAPASPAKAMSNNAVAGTRTVSVSYRSDVPDVGSAAEAAGNENVPAIGPGGARVYASKQMLGPPPVSRGATAAAAAGPWRSAISEEGGVRIRRSTPKGAVLGTMPLYARLFVSCKKGPADSRWFWVAYNPGSRWIYGWSSAPLIEIDPDVYIPNC